MIFYIRITQAKTLYPPYSFDLNQYHKFGHIKCMDIAHDFPAAGYLKAVCRLSAKTCRIRRFAIDARLGRQTYGSFRFPSDFVFPYLFFLISPVRHYRDAR